MSSPRRNPHARHELTKIRSGQYWRGDSGGLWQSRTAFDLKYCQTSDAIDAVSYRRPLSPRQVDASKRRCHASGLYGTCPRWIALCCLVDRLVECIKFKLQKDTLLKICQCFHATGTMLFWGILINMDSQNWSRGYFQRVKRVNVATH